MVLTALGRQPVRTCYPVRTCCAEPCYTSLRSVNISPLPEMSEPLYAQVARDLAQAIAQGRFAEGELLPSEASLCAQYQASRHTVREAIRELADLGLVATRKGVGTRVERPRKGVGFDQELASLDDLVQLAATNLRVVKQVDTVVASRELAREIGCPPGSEWFHIASVRRDADPNNPPICWTDNYVDPAYADLRKLIRKDPRSLISDLIEKHFGRRSVEVEQSITATGVANSISDELEVEAGSPALKIVRRYLDRVGQCFSTTVTVHPQGRFKFSMVLRRSERT